MTMKLLAQLIKEAFTDYVAEARLCAEDVELEAKEAMQMISFALAHKSSEEARLQAFEAVTSIGFESAQEEAGRLHNSIDVISKVVSDFNTTLSTYSLAHKPMQEIEDNKLSEAYQAVEDFISEFNAPLKLYVDNFATWAKETAKPNLCDKAPLEKALTYASLCAHIDGSRLDTLEGLEGDLLQAIGFCSYMCLGAVEIGAEHIPELVAELT